MMPRIFYSLILCVFIHAYGVFRLSAIWYDTNKALGQYQTQAFYADSLAEKGVPVKE